MKIKYNIFIIILSRRAYFRKVALVSRNYFLNKQYIFCQKIHRIFWAGNILGFPKGFKPFGGF